MYIFFKNTIFLIYSYKMFMIFLVFFKLNLDSI